MEPKGNRKDLKCELQGSVEKNLLKLKERSQEDQQGSLKVYFIVENPVDGFDGYWRGKCIPWTSFASTGN